MSKILFISNISNKIGSFVTASIAAAHSLGMDFYQAANWDGAKTGQIEDDERSYGIQIRSIPISRNPLSCSNLRAFKELAVLIEQEGIDYIHCNTPAGGMLGRLVGKKCRVKKVIYQAHGFHFYKGAPKKNWLLYYPIEKWLARYTDALITINTEDYLLAKEKFKLRKGGKVYYVPGVGIDTAQYRNGEVNRNQKRLELGLSENDFALISMGDLIDRKNYRTSIQAIAKANNPNLQYFICGRGPEEQSLKELAQTLGISQQIHFLGFRSDIKELLVAADAFLFTTKQEGLPRSMMEAMAAGLPCIASRIRGNTDLIEDPNVGFLCAPNDSEAFASAMNSLMADPRLCKEMGEYSSNRIMAYDLSVIIQELKRVYSEVRG